MDLTKPSSPQQCCNAQGHLKSIPCSSDTSALYSIVTLEASNGWCIDGGLWQTNPLGLYTLFDLHTLQSCHSMNLIQTKCDSGLHCKLCAVSMMRKLSCTLASSIPALVLCAKPYHILSPSVTVLNTHGILNGHVD